MEKLVNGVWVYVTSWTSSGFGTLGIDRAGKYYVDGGTYRVVVKAKVYDMATNALLEEEKIISSEWDY